MKCFLRYLGVADTDNKIHHVHFEQGLNVITGKSSTGKSAILEIFDYCMGSKEDTIPVGIITERAETFFIVLEFPTYLLVAARRKSSNRCFLREQQGVESEDLLVLINEPETFFRENEFMQLAEFKKTLGRHFAVTLENIDEDPFRKAGGKDKSATPSVRSFSSFMLQHQNLIANKHAIFYRFDEKVKRDQAIEHFKILMGLVDENYFDIFKELELAKYELKKIEAQIPKQAQRKSETIARYKRYLNEFLSLAGLHLIDATAEKIYADPENFLKLITERAVRVDAMSDLADRRRVALDLEKTNALGNKRVLQGQRRLVNKNIGSATQFKTDMLTSSVPASTKLSEAHCPMCDAQTHVPAIEANKLWSAIDWLNDELKLSSYARESFVDERRRIDGEISKVNILIGQIESDIKPLEDEVKRLKTANSINEQATKAKLLLEIEIQKQLDNPESELDKQKKKLEAEVSRLRELLDEYVIQDKLATLSANIDAKMCELGDTFDFEKTYKPSKLRFDIDTFDLWYQKNLNTRVYLRSMGSGANWLYSHLALFLSLHYQFASYSSGGCKIPPILFLDQPTQVYFPASLDHAEEFDSNELAKQSKREKRMDEDMRAVTNMFTQLAKFCVNTGKTTGVTPQIIVSDHADKLKLSDGYQFQDYVRATWRTRGFIEENS